MTETGRQNNTDSTCGGRTPDAAAGIAFRQYAPEEIGGMPHDQLVALFLDEQVKLKEAICIIREQDRMISVLQEQKNLDDADRYGARNEKSRNLKGSGDKSEGKRRQGAARQDGPSGNAGMKPEDGTPGCDGKGKEKPRRQEGCIEDIIKDLPVHRADVTLSNDEILRRYGTTGVKEGPEKVYRECRYIPGVWYVEETHVHTYKDPKSGKIFQPETAERLKFCPGSCISRELLAYVLDQRFTMAVPYYRMEQWLARNHFPASRQWLAGWAIRLDGEMLSALVCRMWHHILEAHRIQIDETPTIVNEVRRRDGTPTSLCYMWNFRTSELLTSVPTVIIFHFDESRGTDVLDECLPGFTGTISSDGHSPYHGFAEKSGGSVTNTGCLNHARSRFAKVIRANPAWKKLPPAEQDEIPAFKVIEMFGKVFRADAALKDASPETRQAGRQEKVKPLFDELAEYINGFGDADFDKSGLMHAALEYFKNQQPYLEGFLSDPYVPNNNSACERDNAGYAILRNNIKFIDSLSGATATADLYSLAATAKAHGADFYTYLLYIMKELPPVLKGRNPNEYGGMEELDRFMVWSEEYRTFAENEWAKRKELIENGNFFQGQETSHRASNASTEDQQAVG